MKMKLLSLIHFAFISVILLSGCKRDWLDLKPDITLALPSSIKDYQALLDNSTYFAQDEFLQNQIGSDDYFINDAAWNSQPQVVEKNLYKWEVDIFSNDPTADGYWSIPYKRIFYSNIILEGIEKVRVENAFEQRDWNNVKGAALFYRAYNLYAISQSFCKPFNNNSSTSDLGVPIRLESDVNIKSERGTVKNTYDAIINDLVESASLLPVSAPINNVYRVRPTKCAAYAMLARVYLSMSLYEESRLYADSALAIYATLLDYNNSQKVEVNASLPFRALNDEVIFQMTGAVTNILAFANAQVEPSLFLEYSSSDLRRLAFFRVISMGRRVFKGNYSGMTGVLFTGLTTGELFLIKAECLVRKGMIQEGLDELNVLVKNRWDNNSGVFQPIQAIDSATALKKVLLERRKELCYRNLRWPDLRRLNYDQNQAITLKRTILGEVFLLEPNDSKYVLPIPPRVILLTGMQQNPRS